MKISWRMILGLSIGLTAWTGCGDSDADNPLDKHTSNLVQTWNSPDGETRVLAGDSPASIVDDALTNEERAKVLREKRFLYYYAMAFFVFYLISAFTTLS